MEDETLSISKGCFLFKAKQSHPTPKKKKKKQVCNKAQRNRISTDKGFALPKIHGESEKAEDARSQLYKENLSNILEEVEEIQSEINYQVFKELVDYVSTVHTASKEGMPISEIPTAALFAGVNMPDHHVTFMQLQEEIVERVGSGVALLQSKDCTNLKAITKDAIAKLMQLEEEDVDSDEDTLLPSKAATLKSWQYTFSELKNWYLATASKNASSPVKSGKKRKFSKEQGPAKVPLVIIFEDFEGFNKKVLQDFILTCSQYTDHLPFVLVFGVATTSDAIHQSLSHAVYQHLNVKQFQAQPPIFALTQIIDKVLLSNKYAWKLGPLVLRMLYENFLYYDFSIQNFAKGMKLSIMEHFYDNILSILCITKEEQIHKNISLLSKESLDIVRNIPSIARYIGKKSLKEQERLKTDNNYFKSSLIRLMTELVSKQCSFFMAVKCLHVLSCKVPGAPLGKKLLDVYELCFKKNIPIYDSYIQSMDLLRLTSRDELQPVVNKCLEILNEESGGGTATLVEERNNLQVFSKKLETIQVVIPTEDEEDVVSRKPENKLVKYKSRHEFREGLKRAVKENRKESPFEKLRSEIIDFFDKMFRKYLSVPMASYPMIEAHFFDGKDVIKEAVNSAPRGSVHAALGNPSIYFKCQCCRCDQEEISPSLPDVCILFKLHLECGKLINLYDWLQSFKAVFGHEDEELTDERSSGSQDIIARFIGGVSTLHHLGIIKPTKRKTDHVARLTWETA